MLSLVEGFSSNPIIVTLAHEVCRRLSSHVLLRKFTINVPATGLLALETVGSFFSGWHIWMTKTMFMLQLIFYLS